MMPAIKDFGACRIYMYFEDHGPPHFHILGPDGAAKVALGGFEILAGSLPRQAQPALAWAREHEDELWARWHEYSG